MVEMSRRTNARALQMIFDDAFAQHPLAHWRRTLDAAGLTFGIVGTVEEAAADEQARAAPPEPNAWLSLLTRAPRAMYLFAPSLR